MKKALEELRAIALVILFFVLFMYLLFLLAVPLLHFLFGWMRYWGFRQ